METKIIYFVHGTTTDNANKYTWQKNNDIEGFLNSYYVKGLKEKGIDIFDWTPFIESGMEGDLLC